MVSGMICGGMVWGVYGGMWWYEVVWGGMARYGVVWGGKGVVWCGMWWYGMEWYGVWYGVI